MSFIQVSSPKSIQALTEVMNYLTTSLSVFFCILTSVKFSVEALSQHLESSIVTNNDSLLIEIKERFFISHRTVRMVGVSEVISEGWPDIPIEIYDEIK